ncbi:MAG: hypothetical protein LBR55_02390, partial [Bacteroidales bacterium]|nr:hypothetical protein [Bacteroidales bacterium]
KDKIGNGFKLYTSYHIGYHFSFFKNRFFVEPQIHCQWWPIDTNTPQEFKEKDKQWHEEELANTGLFIIGNAGHCANMDNAEEFNNIVMNFITENQNAQNQ